MLRQNDIIKFDLHIHSSASEYKETGNIVKDSNIDNIDILLDKLNENEIALFSITDHNRFNTELYVALDNEIKRGRYPKVRGLVAGVEFDVCMEENMHKCHIIAIFDADNKYENYCKIQKSIEANMLTEREAAYSREDFEVLLRTIGMDVILIASQREGIDRKGRGHNSLSSSVTDPREIIEAGYINALEFQKSHVEGILKDCLNKIDTTITLLSGSDCHEWKAYPKHDTNNGVKEFYHSKARMLPTFKGLAMAVTLPGYRFSSYHNTNNYYYEKFSLNDETVPLVNGINVIIGENGSGKTTLIEAISGSTKDKYAKELIKNNGIAITPTVDSSHVKMVAQGEIVKKFNDNTLFSDKDENFRQIDTEQFKNAYERFARDLMQCIRKQIRLNDSINSLSRNIIEYYDDDKKTGYYISIQVDNDFSLRDNPHTDALKRVQTIRSEIEAIIEEDYYSEYSKDLISILSSMNTIAQKIESKKKIVDEELKIRNVIQQSVDDYNTKIQEKSSSQDKQRADLRSNRQEVIESIIKAIRSSIEEVRIPSAPKPINGVETNLKNGFKFTREANYNGRDMLESFLSAMFVKRYRDIDAIKDINSEEELQNAVMNCGSNEEIEEQWEKNLQRFLQGSTAQNSYVLNASNNQIGNTLGELSLSYYKYLIQDKKDWDILIIDQPEDNISNNNISEKLVELLSSIRNKKQIIFVTHNPLLVVNLDVDNVLFIENDSGCFNIKHGCLEYEDNNYNMLEIIAKHMDGGRKAIEKRLRVYGKID